MTLVHDVWQCFLTTCKFTTAVTFLYCGTSAQLAFALLVCKCCRVAQQHAKHRTLHWLPHQTIRSEGMLYSVQHAYITFCLAMTEWVMFETDLWNDDSLSRANCFRFGHCVNTGVQLDSFPAPVPQGKASFALQKHSKVSPSNAQWLYTFVMAGGEKSIGKALLLVVFLSYLDSRTIQTQAVLLEKIGPPFTSVHGEL